jgi:hypothetical protein
MDEDAELGIEEPLRAGPFVERVPLGFVTRLGGQGRDAQQPSQSEGGKGDESRSSEHGFYPFKCDGFVGPTVLISSLPAQLCLCKHPLLVFCKTAWSCIIGRLRRGSVTRSHGRETDMQSSARIGVVLGTIGLGLLISTECIGYRAESPGDLILCVPAFICGALFTTAGFLAMVVSAWRRELFRGLNAAAAFVLVLAFVLFVGVLHPLVSRLREARFASPRHVTAETLQAVVSEVDQVCGRLGRIPRDQKELVSLLGKPMPQWSTDRFRERMYYRQIDPDRYELGFGEDFGWFVYDSGTPDRGWHHPY